ncbi:MAG: hypothetical protein IKT40_00065 [Bacilli bacterium]|nr:hypothetical protein [Bacilli bacterium]
MKNEFEKYYMVIAKCGHVGRKNYIPVKFAVVAESGKEAAKKVRQFPRVKHDHKDAILDVRCITLEEFLEIIEINGNDPYLKCHSRQEQNLIVNLAERMVADLHNVKQAFDKQTRKARVAYKLRKFKNLEESSKKEDYCYAY